MQLAPYLLSVLLFTFIITSLYSCGDGVVDASKLKVIFPDSGAVSYYNHVQPFLNQRCAYAGCHNDYYMAGGRSMSSYFRLFSSENLGLIVSGNAEASVLYQIAKGSNNHLYRYNLPIANENQTRGIKRWINDGALEF